MKTLKLAAFALLACGALSAQTGKLIAELKQNYNMTKDFVTRAADKMPDAEYSFKTTPQTRTYGELVGHVAEGHMFICGLGAPPKPDTTKRTTKADYVKFLKDSFAVCDNAINTLTDAKAMQTIKMMGMDQTVLSSLWGVVVHDNEVYGTMAAYLRLKNQVPPTSEGPPPGAGKKK